MTCQRLIGAFTALALAVATLAPTLAQPRASAAFWCAPFDTAPASSNGDLVELRNLLIKAGRLPSDGPAQPSKSHADCVFCITAALLADDAQPRLRAPILSTDIADPRGAPIRILTRGPPVGGRAPPVSV